MRVQAHQHLCLPFPKPEQGASEPAALSLQFPLAAARARFGKETEPSEAPQTQIWEVGRGRGFPSKLRRAWLRESFSKFPAAPAPVASAGRADGGRRASLAAASAAAAASSSLWTARSREAGRAPGGQALLRGRKPQLTQAAWKAEAAPLRPLRQRRGAYTWDPEERAEAPGSRRPRGRSALRAPGVPEQLALPSSFLGPPRARPRQTQGARGRGYVLGSPASTPSSVSPDPPSPNKFLPTLPLPSNPMGEGV